MIGQTRPKIILSSVLLVSILAVDFVLRHGFVPLFFCPLLPFSFSFRFRFSSPSFPSIPKPSPPSLFAFYYPQICRIRHSLLVMFLYHYLIAQVFFGSLVCPTSGSRIRQVYPGWPLNWRRRPCGHCITLRGVYVFRQDTILSGTPSFVLPDKKLVHFTPNLSAGYHCYICFTKV